MAAIKCRACGFGVTPPQMGGPCPQCGSSNWILTDEEQAAIVVSDKAKVAKELAKRHYQIEPGLTRIIRYSGDIQGEAIPTEPIKLLEVNKATVSSGVMPLHFGPVPERGILFPSVIIEVTPDEFRQIQDHKLKLPENWINGEELAKPSASRRRK